jgi:hypothetical protein
MLLYNTFLLIISLADQNHNYNFLCVQRNIKNISFNNYISVQLESNECYISLLLICLVAHCCNCRTLSGS